MKLRSGSTALLPTSLQAGDDVGQMASTMWVEVSRTTLLSIYPLHEASAFLTDEVVNEIDLPVSLAHERRGTPSPRSRRVGGSAGVLAQWCARFGLRILFMLLADPGIAALDDWLAVASKGAY